MTEWSLNVRLTGQGSSLRSTLRGLSGDADRADRSVNQLRDDIRQLRLAARTPIKVRIDVDADHLRADVNTAINAAGAGQGLAVNLRLANSMQLRSEVEAAVRWAAWGHRINIPIGLSDPMQLRRDVTAAVRWASDNQTIRIRVVPDTSALNNLGNNSNNAGGSSGSSAMGGLKGLLVMAPAAIPLVAGLTASLGPLAGQLFTAGGAATAFGIALAGQIGPLSEVAEAEKAYQDAVREHGTASAEAITAQIKYQKLLAELPPATQQAAVALSQLKTTFKDWSDDMAGFTMAPVSKGFTVLEQLIPHLTPEVKSFSGQLDRLMDVAGGAITTPGFDAFSDRVGKLTDQKLDDFTDQLIHLLRVASEGDADAGTVGKILDYMRENGPAAREALNAIGDAVATLAEGAAQAGPTMLTLVTAAAKLVAALPPEVVAIILQVATALKLLQLAGAGAAAVAAGVTRIQTALAGLAATSAAAGGGLAGLSAAFLSLSLAAKASVVVAGIGLVAVAVSQLMDIGESAPPNVDKLTTSLGNLGRTGKATGYVAQQFGADFGKLNDQIKKVTDPSVVESINNWGADITGGLLDAGDATEEFTKNADAIDESLTNLVRNGNAKLAKAALAEMMKGLDPAEAKKFRGELDGFDQALADLAFEQKLTAESQGIFGEAAQSTTDKLNAQKASADGLAQSILALNDLNRAAGSAMSAFEQSIDDATAAAKENAGALTMRDGVLDLGSEKAREAEKVLSDLAANTQAAATSAREQGQSWEVVQGILSRGQKTFIENADAMGLTREQAEALAASYLKIPDSKKFTLEMRTEDAITSLDSVIAAIEKTPNKKSVTVDALTSDAIGMLEDLGFTVTHLKNGKFSVSANTKTAKDQLASVQAARDGLKNKTITISARDRATQIAANIQTAIDKIRGKTVDVYVVQHTLGVEGTAGRNARNYNADGSVMDFYADGGIRAFAGGGMAGGDRPNQHVAQIAPAGAFRVWAEPETQGEGYVPFAPSKRPRSRAITEEIVRRLGGDPVGIQWNANGGVTDWRYDPQTGSLYSASDAGQAGHKTKKVKIKGKVKEIEYFDVGAVEKKLKSAAKATQAWNADLEKVADRVGGDVAEALAAMGEDGRKLADKMANGSTKYINEMAAALRNLQKVAKASLTDYTRQLDKANKVNKAFSDDLAQLAAMGYGDLAAQLAAQGDEAAQQLADAAAKDPKKAKKANQEAKEANTALTSDQVQDLVQIIAAIKNSKTGIHAVAATTGLGEDEIIAVGNKAEVQIRASLGGRAVKFLEDLKAANAGKAYANGGIRAGIYGTRNGIIKFGEPETGGEGYIPLGANKRRHAMPVLADVARRFGVGLTDGQSARTVVIREQGPLVGSSHFHIGDRRSDRDLARDIEDRQAYQLRRLARGGAFAGSAGGSR
ncbi:MULTISPECIES: hypothetical protein [unclassified Streptomyces]|uniref:hypothetical protein n=1 Tax=unclassified Streptomyces TaxID=2593676 RepID=UPI0036E47A7E